MAIKYTIEISDQETKELIMEVVLNLPEYSQSLKCHGWDYKNCIFDFTDYEDGAEYTLEYKDFVKGFESLVKHLSEGRLKGLFSGQGFDKNVLLDPGNWDAWDVDALVQESIFGEVVYG